MRIAVVSDIHGNLTAFRAVLADLDRVAPDLVLHGGDLAADGGSPTAIVDEVRDRGWPGVLGNADEMLFRPELLASFAADLPGLQSMFATIEEMAAWTRDQLGTERLAWLAGLPSQLTEGKMALVHASPGDPWRAPRPDADEATLAATYSPLGRAFAVHGHVHLPYVRILDGMTVANSGSVGLPYNGDPRASYLLLDDGRATIRRVTYDIDVELARLRASGLPHHEWVARMIRSARSEPP